MSSNALDSVNIFFKQGWENVLAAVPLGKKLLRVILNAHFCLNGLQLRVNQTVEESRELVNLQLVKLSYINKAPFFLFVYLKELYE